MFQHCTVTHSQSHFHDKEKTRHIVGASYVSPVPAPCVRTPGWSWSRTLACRRSCTASPPPCGTPPCSQSSAQSCTVSPQSTPLARSCTPPGTGWCTPRPGHWHTPPPPHPVSQVNISLSLVSPHLILCVAALLQHLSADLLMLRAAHWPTLAWVRPRQWTIYTTHPSHNLGLIQPLQVLGL